MRDLVSSVLKEAVEIINTKAGEDRSKYVFLAHELTLEAVIGNGLDLRGDLDMAICFPECI